MTHRTLVAFFLLSFGIAWGVLALFVLFKAHAEALFGPVGGTRALFILAVYAPAVSAIGLALCHHGAAALRPFLRRLLMWRMPGRWWRARVIGLPLATWPDALPRDSAVFGVPTAVLVVFNRDHCFDRSVGAMEVLAPAPSERGSSRP
jgi:hypothetical protein